jgi:manganese-dependent inorganic pyrophosphatase
LKSQQGQPSLAIASGKPNPETQFALDFFKLKAPEVMLNVANRKVILVDHNTYTQAPDDIKQAEIVGIIDHHSLGGISTDEPIEVLIKPVGCNNTIIWQLYQQAGIPIPASIAGGMLTAILSDTLAFRSPTTTESDQIAAKSLASIAGIDDIQKYAHQMFLAGEVDLKTASIDSLLQRDFKNFEMSGNKVGIAQLSAFNFELLKKRKKDFYEEMQQLLNQQGYKTIVLMLTDVQSMGSEIVLTGAYQADIAKAFNLELNNHSGWADGVMSRKKQVVPLMEKVFKNK